VLQVAQSDHFWLLICECSCMSFTCLNGPQATRTSPHQERRPLPGEQFGHPAPPRSRPLTICQCSKSAAYVNPLLTRRALASRAAGTPAHASQIPPRSPYRRAAGCSGPQAWSGRAAMHPVRASLWRIPLAGQRGKMHSMGWWRQSDCWVSVNRTAQRRRPLARSCGTVV